MKLSIVILAAGQGTRMRSALPKVLHPLAGCPMLRHVIDSARELAPDHIHVVHGHGGEQVRESIPDHDLIWVEQAEQLGTGHAVAQAMPGIPDHCQVLVLCGDVPLVLPDTLQRLRAAAGEAVALLTAVPADPTGYGRILRDASGEIDGIVEDKDADGAQRNIREINTGLMCLPAAPLRRWLAALSSDNAQGEYYLTDVIAMARRDGVAVNAAVAADPAEAQGVNDRAQLAAVERIFQRRQARRLMAAGVSLADPARFDLRGGLSCGQDVRIDVNAVFEGEVALADGVSIGPNCVIRDSRIGADSVIEANSVLDGAEVADGCHIGPFARLRPGTRLADGARVGNFVETKNAVVGAGAKVNHLSYVGDADIGRDVNVGAGTITCNYDGANKHRTVIEDHAFIGSNTALVAPVRVGRGATVGAGTTLRKDAPPEGLTLTGSRQKTVAGWRRPKKGQ